MKVGVLGLGNVLRRDDGFGPSAVRFLEAHFDLPSGVTVQDLGTPGLDLPSHLVGHDAVLILDTALGAGRPGTLHSYDRRALLAGAASEPRLTGHEADLRAALKVTELLGGGPRQVCLLGVVPEEIGDGLGLSPAIRAAIEPACRAALAQLETWGVHAQERAPSTVPAAWWESPA